jgi:hypothetical protein
MSQNCKQHQIRVHQTKYTLHVPVSPEMMEKCRLTAGKKIEQNNTDGF